jgi:hypothetical protein
MVQYAIHEEDSDPRSLFIVDNIKSIISQDEPLDIVRTMINVLLHWLDGDFATLHPPTGRASIPPEQLKCAQVLMMVKSISSERHLTCHIQYNP